MCRQPKSAPREESRSWAWRNLLGFPFSTAASPQVSGDRVFLFSPGISAQPHMGQGAMEQEGGRSTSTLEAFWYSKQGLRGCLCQGRGTAWGII